MAAGMSWGPPVPITLNSASARRDLGSRQGRAVAFSRSQHRVVTCCMLISILFSLILNIPTDGVSISFFSCCNLTSGVHGKCAPSL